MEGFKTSLTQANKLIVLILVEADQQEERNKATSLGNRQLGGAPSCTPERKISEGHMTATAELDMILEESVDVTSLQFSEIQLHSKRCPVNLPQRPLV